MVLADAPTLSLAQLEAGDPNARSGANETRFLCPLPACADKQRGARHRSLSVNNASGAWRCARCGAGGKITEKWQRRERLTPRARARRAFSLDIQPAAPAARAVTQPVDPTETKAPAWRRMWDAALPVAGTPGESYLRGRGIPVDVATRAGVRYVERWFHWTKDDAGTWQLEGTSRRVVFPIVDELGELVGIQGRAIDQEHSGAKVISRGVAGVFSTWGCAAFAALVKSARVALAEAPIDALSLAVAGVQALSVQGTSVPTWLPRALALRAVMIGFDSDHAGDEASAVLVPQLGAYGVSVERRRPSAKDWNAVLLAAGVDALRGELGVSDLAAQERPTPRAPVGPAHHVGALVPRTPLLRRVSPSTARAADDSHDGPEPPRCAGCGQPANRERGSIVNVGGRVPLHDNCWVRVDDNLVVEQLQVLEPGQVGMAASAAA